jgi:hypothetical protein
MIRAVGGQVSEFVWCSLAGQDRGADARHDLLQGGDVPMYPASSRVVNCLDSAESDSPTLSRMNLNSDHSVAASSATMDNRVGAWMSSSNRGLIIGGCPSGWPA